jgi:hypothetical protein
MDLLELAKKVFVVASGVAMLTLFVTPFLIYPIKERLAAYLGRRKVLRKQIALLRQQVDRLGNAYQMTQLGAALVEAGQHEEAEHWLQEALRREPSNLDARYHLGRCLLELKKPAEAAAYLESVVRERPTHEYGNALLLLAQAQELAGNRAQACETYRLLLKHYPYHPEGSYRYALLLDNVGSREEAVHILRDMVAALEQAPAFQRRRQASWLQRAKFWLATRLK